MWSAGGPNANRYGNNQGTGSKYGGGVDLDDDLDALGDDDDDDDDMLGSGLNKQFSANKASSH